MTHADVIHDQNGRHRHTRRISFSGTVSNRVAGNSLQGFLKSAARHFYGSLIINGDTGITVHVTEESSGTVKRRAPIRKSVMSGKWSVTFPENGIRSNLAENRERKRERERSSPSANIIQLVSARFLHTYTFTRWSWEAYIERDPV